jgi:hypothetical protein
MPQRPQVPARLIAAALAIYLIGAYSFLAICIIAQIILALARIDYGPANVKPVNGVLDAARVSILHQSDWPAIAAEALSRLFPLAIIVVSALLLRGRGPLARLVRRAA